MSILSGWIKHFFGNPPLPKSLDTIHREKTGKISDKWASYLPHYDNLFAPLREGSISLLEIGVNNGGSLDTWATYFSNARHIVGCDIDERCERLRYPDPRIHVIIGNANENAARETIASICGDFDIVIDDGSHHPLDIGDSFLYYFTQLKPGGIYVVEDTHSFYRFDWHDEARNPVGGSAFFKRLIDLPNHQFWESEHSIGEYLEDFFPGRSVPPVLLEGWVDSLEFKNSLIVIRKALAPGHAKLGERLICGREPLVPPSQ